MGHASGNEFCEPHTGIITFSTLFGSEGGALAATRSFTTVVLSAILAFVALALLVAGTGAQSAGPVVDDRLQETLAGAGAGTRDPDLRREA